MFANKNVKYWKNTNPVLTELPCEGGDNDEGDDDKVNGSIKDVRFNNVYASDGENKVDLGGVYNGGGDSNDDVGFGNVGEVNTNGGYNPDFSNGDSKFDYGNDKEDGGVDDDRSEAWVPINQILPRCFCSYRLWLNKTNHWVKQVDINEPTDINQSIPMNQFYPIEASIFIRDSFVFA